MSETSAEAVRTERLCENLGEVLHAIAQPLTILQVRLDMGASMEMGREQLKALAGDAAKEVVRLCNLFEYMQGFLAAETVEPELSVQPLQPLLEHVAEGMQMFYAEAGVALRFETQDVLGCVLVDQRRIVQALSGVLLVGFEVAIAQDTVELTGSMTADGARVVVRNRDAMVPLGREAGLKMALAQANVARQGGRLTWTEEPFNVLIELRAADGDGR